MGKRASFGAGIRTCTRPSTNYQHKEIYGYRNTAWVKTNSRTRLGGLPSRRQQLLTTPLSSQKVGYLEPRLNP